MMNEVHNQFFIALREKTKGRSTYSEPIEQLQNKNHPDLTFLEERINLLKRDSNLPEIQQSAHLSEVTIFQRSIPDTN